jgi:AcrR family transcriptional regulator
VLLECALELFGAKGFHATSVQEIVEAAGVTKGAFYHHFAGKADILRLIHDEYLVVYEGLVDEILSQHDSPVDQVRELVRVTALTVTRYQAHVSVFAQERRHLTEELRADVKRRADAVEDKMEQIVSRGVESGELEPDVNPRIAVLGILGITLWMQQWYRPDGPLPAEAIADEFARMVLTGLCRAGSDGSPAPSANGA